MTTGEDLLKRLDALMSRLRSATGEHYEHLVDAIGYANLEQLVSEGDVAKVAVLYARCVASLRGWYFKPWGASTQVGLAPLHLELAPTPEGGWNATVYTPIRGTPIDHHRVHAPTALEALRGMLAALDEDRVTYWRTLTETSARQVENDVAAVRARYADGTEREQRQAPRRAAR
jgi:hypothetical protein